MILGDGNNMARFMIVCKLKTGGEAFVCFGRSSADAMAAYQECLPDISLDEVVAFKMQLFVQLNALHGFWKVVRTWRKQ